jgi:hypothetical protein
MDHSANPQKCCCTAAAEQIPPLPLSKKKITVRSVSSALLSILIAFFPKCPLCWAAYMSMFGSLGIARLPYMGWLFPVLLLFLGMHLLILYKKAAQIGYLPFFISLLGALLLLFTRILFPSEKWLLLLGMASIISGSLLNSFSGNRWRLSLNKNDHILQS